MMVSCWFVDLLLYLLVGLFVCLCLLVCWFVRLSWILHDRPFENCWTFWVDRMSRDLVPSFALCSGLGGSLCGKYMKIPNRALYNCP